MRSQTAEIVLDAEYAAEFEDQIATVRRFAPPELRPLVPELDVPTGPWRPATPCPGESLRWHGRAHEWMYVALGEGDEMGLVIVADFRGRRERVDSFEAALRLADTWQR